MLKIVSWNVNGLRTRIIDNKESKDFKTKTIIEGDSHLGNLVNDFNPDIICFQETRCGQLNTDKFEIQDYHRFYNSSELTGARSGDRYSGVAIWSKIKPNLVVTELPTLSSPNKEGRILILYYDHFILINTYQPNTGTNFDYRITEWDPAMAEFLEILNTETNLPIIWTGDLNIARTHQDIFVGDIRYQFRNNTEKIDTEEKLKEKETKYLETDIMKGIGENAMVGFTREERENFREILDLGFTDVWRHLNPNTKFDGYTWWNMRYKPYRKLNRGWRIDYFVINNQYLDLATECKVFKHIGEPNNNDDNGKVGSDHAPIGLTIKLPNQTNTSKI